MARNLTAQWVNKQRTRQIIPQICQVLMMNQYELCLSVSRNLLNFRQADISGLQRMFKLHPLLSITKEIAAHHC